MDKICYTLNMSSRTDWSKWIDTLHRFKLEGFVSLALSAGAPLTLLGAQALYITQPFVGGKQIEAMAHMLEDEEETQAFARLLRGEVME